MDQFYRSGERFNKLMEHELPDEAAQRLSPFAQVNAL
jgi:hypothetical protein